MSRPYVVLRRGAWASLANNTEIDLDAATLERLRGLGDPTSSLYLRQYGHFAINDKLKRRSKGKLKDRD